MDDRVKPACVAPKEPSALRQFIKQTFFTGLLTLFSPYLLYLTLTKYNIFENSYKKSQRPSIKQNKEYQETSLAKRVWNDTKGCGAAFWTSVEFQQEEGWCGSATMRCVLKSLVALGQLSADKVPAAKRGPMTAAKFAATIDEVSGTTKSRIVSGSDGYDAFLAALRLSNDQKYRLSINFLRSSLFGSPGTVFFPPTFMKTFFGGHFSPIVAYLEEEDLVAVFDVNHNYGLFFVSSRRLFDSIATFDVQSGLSRAVVVSEVIQGSQQRRTEERKG